jgi:integrase
MIYKRGKTWWFEFRYDGERIRESTNQGNKKAAKDIEAARRTSLAKGEAGIKEKQPIPTFTDFSERFKTEMESVHSNKPKTLAYYKSGVRALGLHKAFQKAKLDEIDAQMVADYIAKRRVQKKQRGGKTITIATVNRELEVLRRMLRLAVEWGVIDRAPHVSRQPGEVGRDRIVSHSEEQRYLAVAKQPLRDIATALIDTGLRPEEAFRMQWQNVRFDPAGDARYGYIHNPFGKTKHAKRNVSMTPRVRALLEMRHEEQGRPEVGWVFPADTKSDHVDSLKSQHRKALKESKITPPFVLYSLRHTMLTRLGEAGADAFSIQKIAGHSSIIVSEKYVHPTPERIEGAFTQLQEYNARKEAELKAEQERQLVQ